MESAALGMDQTLLWFLIGLACVISEFFIPGVIIVFFGVGAWAVALVTYFADISVFVQVAIFTLASIISLVTLRRRFNPPVPDDDPDITDEFIGKTAIVEETVAPGIQGRVTFKGALWKAETRTQEKMAPGRRVRITERESIILFVEPDR